MKGSTEHRASNPSERGRREVVLTLGTARRMLPLVARIIEDLLQLQGRHLQLLTEQEHLDDNRHKLDWPRRQRRYQVTEEARAVERLLGETRSELQQLGVDVIAAQEGRVGLPTVVNGHPAYFSWKPGDESLRHWHFAGEMVRRNIPASWKDTGDVRKLGKS